MTDLYYKVGFFVLKYEVPIFGCIIGALTSYTIHEVLSPLFNSIMN